MQHSSRHVDACATLERRLVEAGGAARSSILAGELRHRGKERNPPPNLPASDKVFKFLNDPMPALLTRCR